MLPPRVLSFAKGLLRLTIIFLLPCKINDPPDQFQGSNYMKALSSAAMSNLKNSTSGFNGAPAQNNWGSNGVTSGRGPMQGGPQQGNGFNGGPNINTFLSDSGVDPNHPMVQSLMQSLFGGGGMNSAGFGRPFNGMNTT